MYVDYWINNQIYKNYNNAHFSLEKIKNHNMLKKLI